MAYTGSLNPHRRIGALAGVAAVQLVIGYALVSGLAGKLLERHDQPPVIADNYPLPPPPPPPKEPPRNESKPLTKPAVTHETHALVPFDQPTFTPVVPSGEAGGTLGGSGHAVEEVRLPQPDPAPSPALTRAARARGNPGLWVTPNDYPAADLRLEHSGVTRFRLAIGADGRVTDCTVTVSSGYPTLDQAACARLSDRARFEPALDSTGARVAGAYTSSVRWQIPE